MSSGERSISRVLQEIVGNVQDIVRAEVRLAKTELGEELGKARSAGLLVGVGAVATLLSALFLLWAIVYALSLVMPEWAAALVVAVVIAIMAGALLTAGLKRFKIVHPAPKTAASLKENLEWAKQLSK